MPIKNLALYSFIATSLIGCASGPSPQPDLPDSLTVQIKNDAVGTMIMRGGYVHTYTSERCEGPERKANKMSMDSDEALTTLPLVAGKPLTFSVTTLNAQGMKGNWGCTATTTFTPAAGSRYRAQLQTEGDNRTCTLQILDQKNMLIPTIAPEYSCDKTMAGLVKNGQHYAKSTRVGVGL